MAKMKNSGVEWIGNIPEDWNIEKIGSLFNVRNEKVNDTDYEPLSVSKGGIVPQMENVAKTDANDNRKMVLKNDFVINSRSDRKQSCGVSPLDGSVSLINTVLYANENAPVHSPYLNYLLKNYGFAEEFYRWGHGIVADLWTTRWQEMKSISIPLPSVEKQKELVSAIESKTTKIDSLIANEEKQIEKLKTYKQSLITETVTKGLDKNAKMKDSGVEWIGKIPEGWGIEKLKFNTSFENSKWNGEESDREYIGLEHIESFSGRKVETDSVYDKDQSLYFEKNDVLFGKLRPYLAKVYLSDKKGCCSSEFSVIRPKSRFSPKYLWCLLISKGFIDQVDFSTYGTKMPRANADFIKNMLVPIPSIHEQECIANFLDEKCTQIDKLISLKESKIEKLNAYKKSLIYEYVTGKKEA